MQTRNGQARTVCPDPSTEDDKDEYDEYGSDVTVASALTAA